MKETKAKKTFKPYEEQVETRFKNYRLMLYFGLASIGCVFLFLSIAYFFNSYFNSSRVRLQIPLTFVFSTLSILISSYTLHRAKIAFRNDDFKGLKQHMIYSSLLATIFLGLQFWGWVLMNQENMSIIRHGAAAFLFVISGLHVLHIVGGFLFMLAYTLKCAQDLDNEIQALVFFSEKKNSYQIELLNTYWHFLGIVWIYTILFFVLIR